ncbi:MAG: lytic murein transglycosylase B [Nitrosomonadales bacterium]|nr:lytic murein transglycosylase B [Nitrosomonadales bacterium]
MKNIYQVLILLLAFAAHPICAATLPGIPEFIDNMVAKHRFNRAELERAFALAQHQPPVIDAISRPATLKPWPEYRASFVNPERIKFGLEFWRKHRQILQRAEQKYGVPQEIILAVIGVETVYGRDAGRYRVLDALTTLAFDYPRRADFFRSELENYLLLARDDQYDLLDIRGSYAGAMGIPQFMPSSHRKYAVDFNGNHKIDLQNEPADAIGSVANYLQGYGWASGKRVAVRAQANEIASAGEITTPRTLAAWSVAGVIPSVNLSQEESARIADFTVEEGKEYWLVFNNFDVITRYNNSDFYAMSVFQLAEAMKAARKSSDVK